jgi:hypothetical protein
MNNEECKGNVSKATTGVPEMLMAICEMLQRIEQKLDRDYYESEWMVVDKSAHGYGNARPVKVYSPMHVTYGPQGACGDAGTCTSGEKGMTEKK